MIRSTTIAILLVFASCATQPHTRNIATRGDTMRMYSQTIKDSFVVYSALPEGYDPKRKYPVVYLLDANYYFGSMKGVFDMYQSMGMPPVILVGVAYTSYDALDNNRDRDYTFPVAAKEYEMVKSGGADAFLSFITGEIKPRIDSLYRTSSQKQILAGHSLGGYFVTHACLRQMEGKETGFTNFVAASPSLYYNQHYLLKELEQLKPLNKDKISLHVTYGGLEDTEEEDVPGIWPTRKVQADLTDIFKKMPAAKVSFKTDSFSNLGHMETPIPSFVKGVVWMLQKEE